LKLELKRQHDKFFAYARMSVFKEVQADPATKCPPIIGSIV